MLSSLDDSVGLPGASIHFRRVQTFLPASVLGPKVMQTLLRHIFHAMVIGGKSPREYKTILRLAWNQCLSIAQSGGIPRNIFESGTQKKNLDMGLRFKSL